MAFWISLRDQFISLWNRWSIGQRVSFSAATLACLGAVLGTMVWASQPDYVVIASQLKASRAAEIAGILDTEKIGYELNFSSSAVSVASGDVAKARLALKDVLDPTEITQESDPSMFPFPSPSGIADQRRAALERKVAATVMRLRGIRNVTVSISQPDSSPFAVDQSPVTAAVMVEPALGEPVSSAKAQSIIAQVANSVPNLDARNIVLSDTNGRQFGHIEGISHELEMQHEYRRLYETSMAREVEELLTSASGVRAKVKVTAEIDFTKQSSLETKYDPTGKVKESELLDTTEMDAGTAPPVGVPGIATNVPPDANTKASAGGKTSSEKIETKYSNSSSTIEVASIPGKVLRLTVSALVDVQPVAVATADPTAPQTAAAPLLQQQQIESIIRTAVGIDDDRNDEIEVVMTSLAPEVAEVPVSTGFIWEQWQPLVQSISLGLAASLTFLIGMMLMKRMKPIVITQTVGPGIPLADARRLAVISEQAKANPEIVANILSAWLNEQEKGVTPERSTSITTTPKSSASSPTNASIPRSSISQPNTSMENRKAA